MVYRCVLHVCGSRPRCNVEGQAATSAVGGGERVKGRWMCGRAAASKPLCMVFALMHGGPMLGTAAACLTAAGLGLLCANGKGVHLLCRLSMGSVCSACASTVQCAVDVAACQEGVS